MFTEHLNGIITPQEAKTVLDNIGIEEENYNLVIEAHPSTDGLSGHELKALVVVARSIEPMEYSEVYFEMKEQFP